MPFLMPIWKNKLFAERILSIKFGIPSTPANISLFQHLANKLGRVPTYEDWVQNLV